MIANNVSEYLTVYERYNEDFDRKVNNKIKDGWLLYGQPFKNDMFYCQAMVKLNEKEKTVV